MLKNYFKTAWRNLFKHKVSSVINILGLAVGISSCLIIFIITFFELSFDRFHPGNDRIFRIVRDYQQSNGNILHFSGVNSPTPMAVRANLTGFESVAAFHNYYSRVTIPDDSHGPRKFEMPTEGKEGSDIIITEPQYFDIFQYQWLAGNATSLNEPFKVVLSESKAHLYFGSIPLDQMIGKDVIYADSLHVSVSGIVKDWDKNSDFNFKDFISLATVRNSVLKNEIHLHNSGINSRYSQAIVKLANGVTKSQVEANLKKFSDDHKQEVGVADGDKVQLILQPLSDIHFNESYADLYSRKAHLPTLYGLMGIAAFILIIAAINFINLSTAHSIQRAKEIGIRKVLGSSKVNLVFQFLSETFLLTFFAVLLSILIVNPVLSAFHSFLPKGIAFNLQNQSTIIFLILILLLTTLLAGLYPGRILSSYLPGLILKGKANIGVNQKDQLRKALIVFQFTVSLVFIIGTIVIGNQIHLLQNKDLGFTKDAIINIQTSGKYQYPNYPGDKRGLLAERIRQVPGVQKVSVSREELASTDHDGTTILKRNGKKEMELQCQFLRADENFIPLYQLKMLAGHNLQKSDTIKEFVINETCAKALGFKRPEDAVDQLLETGIYEGPNKKTCPIVGVVADFHCQSLREPIVPTFITATNKLVAGSISVKLSTNGIDMDHYKNKIAKIEKLWKEVYPSEKFTYTFFDDDVAQFYEKEQRTAQIINTAMFVAIILSCMGLFGLITFTTEQRTKEIGIRKVLGASVTTIVSMLSKDFLRLVLISILIASPIAYYFLHQWLQNYAYRINISWWMFVLAGLASLFIAFVTVCFKTIRIATSNPVKSLRTE